MILSTSHPSNFIRDPKAEIRQMLQLLLADRLNLKLHREMREM